MRKVPYKTNRASIIIIAILFPLVAILTGCGDETKSSETKASKESQIPTFIEIGKSYKYANGLLKINMTIRENLGNGWYLVHTDRGEECYFNLVHATVIQSIEGINMDKEYVTREFKNIYTGLTGFMAANEGRYPNNLQQLLDGGHLANITLKNRELFYVSGFTASDVNEVILYTSADKNGKSIYLKVDGSTGEVDEDELRRMLAEQ